MSPALTHCQITNLLEVDHQGVGLACLAQQPNPPNWIVVDCMVSTGGGGGGGGGTMIQCKALIWCADQSTWIISLTSQTYIPPPPLVIGLTCETT